MSDSKMITHIVTNYTRYSTILLHKLRSLRALCARHRITISTRHFPTVLNLWADLRPCLHDTPDWRLSLISQGLLQSCFVVLPFYLHGISVPSRMLTDEYLPLVAPRPSLIGVWSRCLIRQGGVLVAPNWPTQQWLQFSCTRQDPMPLSTLLSHQW